MKNVEKTVSDDLAEYLSQRKAGCRLRYAAASVSRNRSPEEKNLEEHLRSCARRVLHTPSGDK